MSLKDLFGKLSKDQAHEAEDLNMDYSDFYSGRSARPAEGGTETVAPAAETPRAGGYYDAPARKSGYEEPDFHSDNSRYYDTPAAPVESPADFVRPREVYEETQGDARTAETFAPAPVPEYLYFSPASYADCREAIVKGLSDGNIVVVRLGALESKDILRIFDYMMGAVQALNAEFIRLEATTVVLVPDGAELDGEALEFEDEESEDEYEDDEYDDEDEYEEDDEYEEEYDDEYEDEEYEEEYEEIYEEVVEEDDADVE